MICPKQNKQDEQILLEYCSGTLDEHRSAEVRNHAAECAECAAWIADQRVVFSALEEFAAPEVSPEFNARLYAGIEEQQRAGWWKQFWRTAWKPALATVAAGVALAIGLMVSVPHSGTPPKKASVENVDMDQVEHALEDLDLLTPGGNRL